MSAGGCGGTSSGTSASEGEAVVAVCVGSVPWRPVAVHPVRRYWTCRCGWKNERAGGRKKCANCGATAPKMRTTAHGVALRDNSYSDYVEVNAKIHGLGEECAVCGREPSDGRHHDRDHGHDRSENSFARPRGLACGGDWGCNKLMSKLTLEKARQIVAYLERVEDYYLSVDDQSAA